MLPSYPEKKRRAFASNILRNTLRLKRGESLLVETWTATLPWAESVVLEARILGVRPLLVLEDEDTYWRSVAEAPTSNVGPVGSHEWAALKASDAHFFFYGPMDTDQEERRPPAMVNRVEANDHEWFRLAQKFGVRSARWDLGRTSEVWAKRYGVDLDQWRDELIDAATVDPRTLRKDGMRVAEVFRRGRRATLTHPNGTDLTLHLAGRKPRVDDGVVDEADVRDGNVFSVVPSGVALVTVSETFAEGTLVSNATGVMFMGESQTPLRGGSLSFEGNHVSKFSFDSGGEAFRKQYAKLGPKAFRPGILSVGLNPHISTIPLLFDQERGTVTVAVGRNNFYGGATRTPHLTAYLPVRGATLEVDGQKVVTGGKLA